MANITVNTTELMELLGVTPADHNLMLVGRHGIGKSEILTNYYNAQGMRVVPLFLGQMSDPGDLIGIPNRNDATGKTEFMPPYWFPLDGKPIVLFLDELNRARPEILQTIMDLALNRTLAGRRLPEGSRIISAVNEGGQYQLTDLDPALVSRFNIVNFRPTVQEWLLWAKKAGVDSRVMEFIQENGIWLDKDPDAKEDADTGLDKNPDRRGWKRVSDIIKGRQDLGGVMTKAISAVVGAKAASAFLSNVAARRIVSGRDVLMNFPKVRSRLDEYELHQLSVVNDGVYRFLEVEKVPAKDLETVKKNVDAYFDYLSHDKKEAAAHFASLYVAGTYPNAVSFLARECQLLTMSMVIYVKGIKAA
ncbi:MAG: AAA family ATPase [Bacteroidales bacterium]|nr:AAA family ATPase [Bacteroidales bacterium]